jgi:hypothetical protein
LILLFTAGCSTTPLRVQSITHNIVFDAEGSPREPYAMEYTNISVVLHNTGNKPISNDVLFKRMPHIDVTDFQVDRAPEYVTNGGYWNPVTSAALPPDAKAQIWLLGHFKNEGTKKATARLGHSNEASTVMRVLKDPGCYSNAPADEIYKRSWTIGRTACLDPMACITSTRSENSCTGNRLSKYLCDSQAGQIVKSVREVECPNGCYHGACLAAGQKDPRTSRFALKLVAPHGGEYFESGSEMHVVWMSKGISQVSFTLRSEKVRLRGGQHTLGVGTLADHVTLTPQQKTGSILIPDNMSAADDWTLTIVQAGEKEPLADTSRPFTIH